MTLEEGISNFEQHIYNTHLKVTRTKKQQPFKYRKNFDSIDQRTCLHLKKIAIFLKKFPHIDITEFISAPYSVYQDEEYFDLEYYTTLKATKAYTLYQNKKKFIDPDDMQQLENIQKSLLFISSFCLENNIPVTEYIEHKTNNTFSFLLHLREHRVNVYCLFGYPSFDSAIRSVDSEILSFTIGSEFVDSLSFFRTKFLSSRKARTFIELGIQKINTKNNLIKTKP